MCVVYNGLTNEIWLVTPLLKGVHGREKKSYCTAGVVGSACTAMAVLVYDRKKWRSLEFLIITYAYVLSRAN